MAKVLWGISALIHNASQGCIEESGWIPPSCPRCHSPLSGKLASGRLLCLKCNREFTLKEVKYAGGG